MVSIVIPVYNNAPTLRPLAERLALTLTDEPYEVIFVDDGSRDDSLGVLRQLAAGDARVKVVALSRNFGQHPATNAGMVHASGDAVVFMDADLQDRPEDVPMLLARLRDADRPVDVVYTVKAERHDTLFTRLTSKLFHAAYARLTGMAVPLGVGTFRAFSRKVLMELLRYEERNILYGPLMFSMGYAHDFLVVSHDRREHGRTSYNFGKRLALAVNAMIRHTDIPYRLFLSLGGATVAGSILYALFNILQYLVYGRILMSGLAVIIVLLLFFMGTVFVALGLLGIYIFQIFQEALRRPRFHVAQTFNLDP